MDSLQICFDVIHQWQICLMFVDTFWFGAFSDTQSYVLNFHGRVTQASVKNFQIVHDNDGKWSELFDL